MSINNRRDFLAFYAAYLNAEITDHRLFGSNIQIAPNSYVTDWNDRQIDSVTFKGTAGKDVLFGGGGETFTFFLGTRGDDLYGVAKNPHAFSSGYVDYSGARTGVYVDMSYRGSRSFTDAQGEARTVDIIGKAHGGFGGTDYFAESAEDRGEGIGSIQGVFGTSHRDVMIGSAFGNFFGGRGNDLLIGGSSHGGEGNDRLIGRSDSAFLWGDEGNDRIVGTDGPDGLLEGGIGNDRIFARAGNDRVVTGDEGNDFIDGGAGDDFIDGGVGKDILLSGSGNDTINPGRGAANKGDGARDKIVVTKADLGAYTDVVLSRSFEAGCDEVRFKNAIRGGQDYRLFTEAQSFDYASGLSRRDDRADRANTVLQIDQDGDGFGGTTPDKDDYFLIVVDVTLTEHNGYLLT